MNDWYKEEVDGDGIFGAGVCEVCGNPGYHDDCKSKVENIVAENKIIDAKYLKEYSISGKFGVVGKQAEKSYEEACSTLKQYTGGELNALKDEAIENEEWWFISHTWIGCVGYIIEKRTQNIYCLGSGWAGLDDRAINARWSGIDAYIQGKINVEVRS